MYYTNPIRVKDVIQQAILNSVSITDFLEEVELALSELTFHNECKAEQKLAKRLRKFLDKNVK